MQKIVAIFSCLFFVALSLAHSQSTPSCPEANGAYVLQDGAWKAMDAVHSMGFKTTNVAGAAFSYGAAKAKVKAQFREAKSPYQLSTGVLSMCLVGVTDSGRDITLARFQEEKDRRELAMASYRLWTGVNAQLDPASIVPLTIDKKGDKIYSVTNKETLSAGEFILFTVVPDVAGMVKANTPGSLGGYDLGYHAGQKK